MSNERSPRDVCSITMGSAGSSGLLAAGCPQFRLAGGLFLVGRPDRLARRRGLGARCGFTSATRRSSAARSRRSSRSVSSWPCAQTSAITASGSSPGRLGLLADQALDVVVGDLMPALSATASSASSRATDWAASARICARAASGVCPVTSKYCSGAMPRRASERRKPSSSSRARVSTSGPAPLDVRGAHERVDRRRAERGVDLLLERRANPPLDVRAQLGQRVELARGSRELVVDLRQDRLVDVLDRDRHARRRAVGELVGDLLRLAGARADERRLDLLHEAARAELDDRVGLRLPVRAQQVDHERVPLAAPAGRRPARARRRYAAAPPAPARRAPRAPRPPRAAPRASSSRRSRVSAAPRSWPRTTTTRRRRRSARTRTPGARDRPHAVARRGGPEPAADVRLDCLGPDAVLADAGDEHRRRHLPLAEPGDLDRLREIVGRVLDGVLELVRRDVHREADAIVAELLHRGHRRPFKQDRFLPLSCKTISLREIVGSAHADPLAHTPEGVRFAAARLPTLHRWMLETRDPLRGS